MEYDAAGMDAYSLDPRPKAPDGVDRSIPSKEAVGTFGVSVPAL